VTVHIGMHISMYTEKYNRHSRSYNIP